MTNKMPVVGKRYKIRNQLGSGNGDIVMVVSVGKDFSCNIYFEKFGIVSDEPLPLASFCNICEELPKDSEPVSIWKNGDELEELEKRNEKFLIRLKDGRVTMPFLGNIFTNDRQIDKNIKEATTLTDFVNSFEQMQKDIEELKKCQK